MNGIKRIGEEKNFTRDVPRSMVVANLHLPLEMAKKWAGTGMPLARLMEVGVEGLERASRSYRYRSGYDFGSYARCWVEHAVKSALKNWLAEESSSNTGDLREHSGIEARAQRG